MTANANYRGALIELPFPPASLSGHHKGYVATEELYAAYRELGSIWKVGARFGLSGIAVYRRFKRANLPTLRNFFTSADDDRLRADYRRYVEAGQLDLLCQEMAREKSTLCERAKKLGLTDARRARELAAQLSAAKQSGTPKWADKPHPRGMLGKRHTSETRAVLGSASRARWGAMTAQEREDYVTKMLKAAIAKNGRIGPIISKRETTWKAGWRDIGDRRHYFRSRWEANYARYLQWLKERGDILDWEYEPETFWFEKIKRGVRSYLPDFRVHELNGAKPLHEVKGWMDARSKTTLKRMAKYHPSETIILIREKEYKAISRLSALIGGWE